MTFARRAERRGQMPSANDRRISLVDQADSGSRDLPKNIRFEALESSMAQQLRPRPGHSDELWRSSLADVRLSLGGDGSRTLDVSA